MVFSFVCYVCGFVSRNHGTAASEMGLWCCNAPIFFPRQRLGTAVYWGGGVLILPALVFAPNILKFSGESPNFLKFSGESPSFVFLILFLLGVE